MSGRKGRIDVLPQSEDSLVAVVEIKASDWDIMTPSAVLQNVKLFATQIWGYVESQLALGKETSPGVIFRKRPKNPKLLELIEELFEKEGISVVWDDESIDERRSR